MKFQAVRFVRKAPLSGMKMDRKWEHGIARVKAYNLCEVEVIIDEYNKLLKPHKLHDYILDNGPLSFINTDYSDSE